MPVLNDAYFMYTCIQKPVAKYDADDGDEYKVDVIISEEAADEWDETFPKQKAKRFKNAEFSEIYKVDPPFDGQKYQYKVTLKKAAQIKDGSPLPEKYRPRAFLALNQNEMTDITETTLVGNGSQGMLIYEIVDNKYGEFAKLKGIVVNDLVPYEGGGGVNIEDEVGMKVRSPKADAMDEAKAAVAATPAKKSRAKAKAIDPDDDIPF